MQSHTLSARYTFMFISFLIALSTFTTGVREHPETVIVLLCVSVLGGQCIVLQNRRLPPFAKEKTLSSVLKIKHCMVLRNRRLELFARKKHCTALKKQTATMVLQNRRHQSFARKKNSTQLFLQKETLHGFPKQKTPSFCKKKKRCKVLRKIKPCMVLQNGFTKQKTATSCRKKHYKVL